MTYDVENRLVRVSESASQQVTEFVYDGDGQRVQKTAGETTTVYVGNHYEVEGSTVRKYYYAGSQRVAVRENSTLHYLLGDHPSG